MILTPLTELDAINEIITATGEDGILSIEEVSENADATMAQKMIESVSREIQQEGWDFNTIPEVTLFPDTNTGKIKWNTYFLRLGSTEYRNRGGYLYNITDGTDKFATSVVFSNVIVLIPFDELPEVFRKYVTTKAALAFSTRFLGDAELENSLSSELSKAYADVMTYELDTQKVNVFNNTSVSEVGTR
jgi:hypothetical protein|nr:MAG TPA: tail tubular protein [Caudoviricetes sp.]